MNSSLLEFINPANETIFQYTYTHKFSFCFLFKINIKKWMRTLTEKFVFGFLDDWNDLQMHQETFFFSKSACQSSSGRFRESKNLPPTHFDVVGVTKATISKKLIKFSLTDEKKSYKIHFFKSKNIIVLTSFQF